MVKLNNYNADEVEPAGSFDPLPVGKYTVVIEDTDTKDTKSGTGSYLKITYSVVDGQYQGRKLFENLNLDNPNPDAVKIANGKLRSICFAVGNHAPDDTEELHDIPFVVTVGIKKGNSEEYPEPQNVIRKYMAVDPEDDAPVAPVAAAVKKTAPITAAASDVKKKQPWAKKAK